jgi:hypothetical protein
MSQIDFPASPAVGQEHTLGTSGMAGYVVWVWDGAKWVAGPRTGGGISVTPPATGGSITVTGTTSLPVGFGGFVKVENAAAAPISVFLPATPNDDQEIEIKDVLGNAGTYPVTVDGVGKMIEGAPTIVISFNYGWVHLTYTGTIWAQI